MARSSWASGWAQRHILRYDRRAQLREEILARCRVLPSHACAPGIRFSARTSEHARGRGERSTTLLRAVEARRRGDRWDGGRRDGAFDADALATAFETQLRCSPRGMRSSAGATGAQPS
jgi:hypothetical protein